MAEHSIASDSAHVVPLSATHINVVHDGHSRVIMTRAAHAVPDLLDALRDILAFTANEATAKIARAALRKATAA